MKLKEDYVSKCTRLQIENHHLKVVVKNLEKRIEQLEQKKSGFFKIPFLGGRNEDHSKR